MDFDQQSYHGRKSFYLPQYFKDNTPLSLFCAQHLHKKTAEQYQREEQTLILQRAELAATRLALLLDAMARDPIAPPENVVSLRESLADHFQSSSYHRCETMGALVRENLESLRRNIGQDVDPLTPAPPTT